MPERTPDDDFLAFLWSHKLYLIVPVAVILAALALFLILSELGAIQPFDYDVY